MTNKEFESFLLQQFYATSDQIEAAKSLYNSAVETTIEKLISAG